METVMWFGRWGSNAVRVYIEDAVSKAPGASSLALAVAQTHAGGMVPQTENVPGKSSDGELATLRREVDDLKSRVRAVNELPALEDGPPEVRLVRFLRGKTHIAHACAAMGAPSGRAALCGWSFGTLSAKECVVEGLVPVRAGEVCRSCLMSCGALGVSITEAPASPSSGSSSSGGSNSSV